jgi:phosphopantothenoylcysteine decarboxylase/phosphopantothenate--cysteine ligase
MVFTNVSGKRIVLGVCGGIAAYKVVELARELTQAGASVKVVMTPSATKFVGPITFSTLTGNPVATDLFPDPPPPEISHTALGRWADLVVVAPATAKIIAKYAVGMSDDLLSALLLATRAPVVMAPAMHTEMWENEATAGNVRTLSARGVRFVDPEVGALAGPEEGVGRLAEISSILKALDDELGKVESLAGLRVVVTAGGTREPIDAVRFISNRSSGRMGYAIASEASRRGAKVTLITAPTNLESPAAGDTIRVTTAAEMKEAVLEAAEDASVVIMAAAVADWRPTHRAAHKLKKAAGPPKLELEPTDDILEELARRKGERILIGFSAESENLEEHASKELHSKGLDMVVANLVGAEDSGFDADTNRAVLLDRNGRIDRLPLMSKRELARLILDALSERFL